MSTPAPTQIEQATERPTVDDMSEWSFPASDPPATWTWDVAPATDAAPRDEPGHQRHSAKPG